MTIVEFADISIDFFPVGFLSPEIHKRQYTRKTDIWFIGLLFLEFLFGSSVFHQFSSPSDFIKKSNSPDSLKALLYALFSENESNRPSAVDLLQNPILYSDSMSFSIINTGQISNNLTNARPGTLETLSRYKMDFEEVVFLGKGGFGSVAKAKNKLGIIISFIILIIIIQNDN